MVTCIYMVESLCCSPEIIITLLIGYTPLQNKTFKKQSLWLKQCENVSMHCQPCMWLLAAGSQNLFTHSVDNCLSLLLAEHELDKSCQGKQQRQVSPGFRREVLLTENKWITRCHWKWNVGISRLRVTKDKG